MKKLIISGLVLSAFLLFSVKSVCAQGGVPGGSDKFLKKETKKEAPVSASKINTKKEFHYVVVLKPSEDAIIRRKHRKH